MNLYRRQGVPQFGRQLRRVVGLFGGSRFLIKREATPSRTPLVYVLVAVWGTVEERERSFAVIHGSVSLLAVRADGENLSLYRSEDITRHSSRPPKSEFRTVNQVLDGYEWVPRTLRRGQLGSMDVRSTSKPFQGQSRASNWVGGDYILITAGKLLQHGFIVQAAAIGQACLQRKQPISYVIHAFLMAVIFRGSCGPLYSSPRTNGAKAPVLILLICG